MADVKDPTILGSESGGVVRIRPHTHKWAWDLYLTGRSNNWDPSEVSMVKDIEQWRSASAFSDAERLLVKRCLGFFAGSESLVADNLLSVCYRYVRDPECYSTDTEVLTPKGWKKIVDLLPTDLVAQVHEDGTSSFTAYTNPVRFKPKSEMYHFTGSRNRVDILVTDNHQMVYSSNGVIRKAPAEHIKYHYGKKLPVAAKLVGSHNSLTDSERLLIAFQADGYMPTKGNNGGYSGRVCIGFNIKKKRKLDKLKQLLDRMGLEYKTHNYEYDKGSTRIHVFVEPGFPVKDFSWVDLGLVNSDWCKEFIDELSNWDGTVKEARPGYISYSSTNLEALNIAQAIAVCAGYACHISPDGNIRSENHAQCYRLGIRLNTSMLDGQSVNKEKVAYSGDVCCITVPTGMLIVRRNSKVAVSGNCKQFIIRQMGEEAIHNHTLIYICDSLGLDEDEVYGAYQSIPAIKAKDDFLMGITKEVAKPGFRMYDWADAGQNTRAKNEVLRSRQEVLRNLITYYIVCEGTFFYSGFAMLLAFGQQNKLRGICKQIEFTLRDEVNHVKFGTRLINEIIAQEPQLWSESFQAETIAHIKKTVELENDYAKECLPKDLLGLRASLFLEYIQYIANRRLEGIGLKAQYPKARNPFPWLTESIDLRKHGNFFETTITEYAKSSSLVDDM